MTDQSVTDPTGAESRREFALYLFCGSLATVIFVLDLSLPLGVALGVPYTAVILLSLRKHITSARRHWSM